MVAAPPPENPQAAGAGAPQGIRAIRVAVDAGRMSPRALVSGQVATAARLDRSINAFAAFTRDGAVDVPDMTGPLAGTTFAVKDVIAVQGAVNRFGLPDYPGFKAERSAEVVRRLERAGATLLGTTRMDALGLGDGPASPSQRVINPVDVKTSPGGSSSGSASAVAGGLCTFALGTDCGGSVRGPAAHCGIVGFKPTNGVVPSDGVHLLSRTCDAVGILGLDVEDVALLHEIIVDRGGAMLRNGALDAARIGFVPPDGLPPLDDEVSRDYMYVLDRLRSRGMSLGEVRLGDFFETSGTLRSIIVAHEFESEFLTGLDRVAWDYAEAAGLLRDVGSSAYQAALSVSGDLRADSLRRMAGFDVLLLPTQPAMPAPVGHRELAGSTPSWVLRQGFNLLGWPAVTLPIHAGRQRLSAGLQIVAPSGCDRQVLAVAVQVEGMMKSAPPRV